MSKLIEVITYWRTWESIAIISGFIFAVVTTAPLFFGNVASKLGITGGIGFGIVLGSLAVAIVSLIISLMLAADPLREEPDFDD